MSTNYFKGTAIFREDKVMESNADCLFFSIANEVIHNRRSCKT